MSTLVGCLSTSGDSRLPRRRPPADAISSLLGPAVSSFRALSGRLKSTLQRHEFNKDSSLFARIRTMTNPDADQTEGQRLQFKKKLSRRNVKRFRGGLVFKAHRLLYHSILGSRIKKKKKKTQND